MLIVAVTSLFASSTNRFGEAYGSDIISDIKNMDQETVAIDSICKDLKCIGSMDVDPFITTNGNLAPSLVIPGGGTIPLNGTKEQTTNWYHFLLPSTETHFRNILINREFSPFPNMWPFERYDVDLFIVFKTNVSEQNFSESLQPTFGGSLPDQDEWSIVNETTSFEPPESIKDYSPLYFPSADFTVIHHKIILSHSPDFIWNNLMYFIISFAPAGAISAWYLALRHLSPTRNSKIMSGILVFNVTSFFTLLQFLPSDFILIKIMMMITMPISGFLAVKNYLRKDSHNQERDAGRYETHINSLIRSFYEKSQSLSGTRYFELMKDLPEYEKKMILQHLYTYRDDSIKPSILYIFYLQAIASNNNIIRYKRDILNNLSYQMENKIRSIGFVSSQSENWIQPKDFEQAINFSRQQLAAEVSRNDTRPLNYVRRNFSIKWEEDKKEWRLGMDNNPFAGSNDKKKIEELFSLIKEYSIKINEYIPPIEGEISVMSSSKKIFNDEFEKVRKSILEHGSNNFGACYHCINWVADGKEKEYKDMIKRKEKEDRVAWGY